ncbi:Cocaine esterase [Brevundimonas vesicularis]|uniref:Cocaine esterase n=1 Tax=Brevundimonas vesicularis TaxID=41276 RepID=A0A2X1BDJ3_BREVE|nr:CocE/NonD family hydrolase [Brevundimonas vesicularis]SPU54807.1 Cocaine esterase [Brevundimonas vesicularis]
MVDVNVQPFEIEIRTRYGDLVRADVYLPRSHAGALPVLFGASPYQKALRRLPPHWVFPFIEYGPIQLYLDEGYAYVAMDVPGTGRSEGIWDFVSRREGEAIHDMIEHVAAQDWSSGAVGMIGMSYYCWSQWNAARTRPPSLKCLGAYDGATDMYRDWMYHGGMPTQEFLSAWLFGSILTQHQNEGHDIRGGGRGEAVYDILSHPLDDDWQRERSPFWELDQIEIPVLSIGVWGKSSLHLRGNFTGFERVSGPRQLVVTAPDSFAGAQTQYADPEFHRRELLPWYDHHLKDVDNGIMDRPSVRFFVQGEQKVREATAWPPDDVQVAAFFLSGEKSGVVTSLNDGSLAEQAPSSDDDATSWSYPDPEWMAGVTTFDEKGVPDHIARVTTFTSWPFERDREFTGNGVLVLHASSDQTDMDVIVKLSLLSGEGEAIKPVKVSQGWLRASHRAEDAALTTEMRPFHSHSTIEPITPGQVYELRVELIPMSFLVRKGERIRLEISNTDSMITDAPMTHFYGQKVGTDTYHHDAPRPSCLRLHERPRSQPGETQ